MHDENTDSETPSVERQSFIKLTRELASVPLEKSAAALETSAAIASISLRAGIEFLRDNELSSSLRHPCGVPVSPMRRLH